MFIKEYLLHFLDTQVAVATKNMYTIEYVFSVTSADVRFFGER